MCLQCEALAQPAGAFEILCRTADIHHAIGEEDHQALGLLAPMRSQFVDGALDPSGNIAPLAAVRHPLQALSDTLSEIWRISSRQAQHNIDGLVEHDDAKPRVRRQPASER